MRRRLQTPLFLSFALCLVAGCPPSNECTSGGTTGGTTSSPIGGPVAGAVDAHCWQALGADGGLVAVSQPVSYGSCYVTDGGLEFDEDAGSDLGGYGPIRYNANSVDDDCKYVVGWTSTPIAVGQPVTLWVSAQFATSGAPLTGMLPTRDAGTGEIYLEAAGAPGGPLGNHVSPTISGLGVPIQESPAGSGVYRIGPAVFFDVSGLWYLRFHFNDNCDDILSDSPHGHAAFYVNVP